MILKKLHVINNAMEDDMLKKEGEKLIYLIIIGNAYMLQSHLEVCRLGVLYVDENGNTPFLVAALQGNMKCIRILLYTGQANFKQINYFGQNALTLATYSGNFKCVAFLLKNWSYRDYNETSFTPPICVAAMCGHLKLVKYFATCFKPRPGALATCHSVNALMLAITYNRPAVVEFLSKDLELRTGKNLLGQSANDLLKIDQSS